MPELEPPSEPESSTTTGLAFPFTLLVPFAGAGEAEENVACLITAARSSTSRIMISGCTRPVRIFAFVVVRTPF